jgi:hypothetical protein
MQTFNCGVQVAPGVYPYIRIEQSNGIASHEQYDNKPYENE